MQLVLCPLYGCSHCERENKHASCFVCSTWCVWSYPTHAVSSANDSRLATWKYSNESEEQESSHLLSSGLTPSYRSQETAAVFVKSTHFPITDQSALSTRVDVQHFTAYWIKKNLLCSHILSQDTNRVIQLFLVVRLSAIRKLVSFLALIIWGLSWRIFFL